MKDLLVALALTACLTSCETPEVLTTTNPVTGQTSSMVRNNFVPCKGPFFGEIQLYPARITLEGKPQFVLSLRYASSDWLFIQGPLIANIDGKVVRYSPFPTGTSRDVQPGAIVVEDVHYLVKESDIAKIANASKILMEVDGQRGVFYLSLTPQNIAAFKQFLASNP